MSKTAAFNLVNTALAGVGGILVARVLGAEGRGDYAVLMSWLGICLVFGELGLTAAVTYHIARDPDQGRDWLTTCSRIMTLAGLAAIPLALLATPLITDGREVREQAIHVLVFVLPIAFVGAAYTCALQATNIEKWNWVRFSQPLIWFVCLAIVTFLGKVTLNVLFAILVLSMLLQLLLAFCLCVASGLASGRYRSNMRTPLLRYGIAQLGSTVPSAAARQLDVIVLATMVTPERVGIYAVAFAYSQLSSPLAAAVGSVAFPRQAKAGLTSDRLVIASLVSVVAVTVTTMVPLMCVAGWLLPRIFGQDFHPSVHLLWFLLPGLIAMAVSQVCGDLLRGMGRQKAVATASWLALGIVLVGLYLLVPGLGSVGAALSVSVAQTSGCALLMFALFKVRSRPGLAQGRIGSSDLDVSGATQQHGRRRARTRQRSRPS